MNGKIYNPPAWGLLWLWLTLTISMFFILQGNIYSLISIPFLIVCYHGLHEVMHDTIIPRTRFFSYNRNLHNKLLGIFGYGIIGHNFILIRYSHREHHNCGRADIRCTIDGGIKELGIIGYIRYYFLLMGLGYLLHEIAGYLYLFYKLLRYNPLNINQNYLIRKYREIMLTQVIVLTINIVLFYFIGLYFIIIKLSVMVYWGFTQNVAHYKLEIEKNENSKYASRSYRVSKVLNNLLFGATFHHLEHHMFPSIPGVNLNNKAIQSEIRKKLNASPILYYGFASYIKSFLSQLKGPPSLESMNENWISNE